MFNRNRHTQLSSHLHGLLVASAEVDCPLHEFFFSKLFDDVFLTSLKDHLLHLLNGLRVQGVVLMYQMFSGDVHHMMTLNIFLTIPHGKRLCDLANISCFQCFLYIHVGCVRFLVNFFGIPKTLSRNRPLDSYFSDSHVFLRYGAGLGSPSTCSYLGLPLRSQLVFGGSPFGNRLLRNSSRFAFRRILLSRKSFGFSSNSFRLSSFLPWFGNYSFSFSWRLFAFDCLYFLA